MQHMLNVMNKYIHHNVKYIIFDDWFVDAMIFHGVVRVRYLTWRRCEF